LQLALDTAQLGWWRHDPRSSICAGDARFKEIFDVAADEIPAEEFKKQIIHPDDAKRFWADHEADLDPAAPQPFSHEYRVQRGDGEVRWVEVHRLVYFDGDQRGREAVSVIWPTTKLPASWRVIEAAGAMLRYLPQCAPDDGRKAQITGRSDRFPGRDYILDQILDKID
jgi:PAS domain S-box-containing protein